MGLRQQYKMIPISLTIRGLYAYQEEQKIDFEQLAQNKLFGIFGKVGSGKTTILDAITLALYGTIKRLDSKLDGRDYLNLASDSLFVELLFRTGRDGYLYKSSVTGQRDKKGDKVTIKKQFSRQKESSAPWEIAPETAEKIIGLSLESFRRTVIIPQNQFQEFLSLGDADRSRMMNELFNLSQYQLREQATVVQNANQFEVKDVERQLEEVANISEQLIENQKVELKNLEQFVKEKALERDVKIEEEKKWESLREKYQATVLAKSVLDNLEKETPQYQNLEKAIEQRDFYEKQFRPYFDTLKNLAERKAVLEKETVENSRKKNALSQKIASQVRELDRLKTVLDSAEIQKAEADDLRKIAQILSLEEVLEKNAASLNGLDEKLKILNESRQKVKTDIEKSTSDLDILDKKMPDVEVLNALYTWFLKKNNALENVLDAEKNVKNTEGVIQELRQKKQTILAKNGFPPEADAKPVDDILAEIQAQKETTELKVHQLFAQKELVAHAENLLEGTPCPVCGSIHHPDLLKKTDNLEAKALDFQTVIKSFDILTRELTELRSEYALRAKQRQEQKKKHQELAEILSGYLEGFIWSGYSPDDFAIIEQQRAEAQSLHVQRLDIEKNIKIKRESLEKAQREYEETNTTKNDVSNKLIALDAERKTLAAQLTRLKSGDFLGRKDLIEQAQSIENQVFKAKSFFEKTEKELRDIEGELANLTGFMASQEKNLNEINFNLQKNELEINPILVIQNLTRTQVSDILNTPFFTENDRKRVAEFRENLAIARAKHQQAVEILRGQVYDSPTHEALRIDIQQVSSDLTQKNQAIGSMRQRLEKLGKDFVRRQNLEFLRGELSLRAEDLKTLMSLFRGEGFVKYVSGIYLHNICEAANERFQKLTRNTLQLTLDSDNQFKINDLLHDGRQRDIKTLSGGQIFQASLSLALALSDNIRATSSNNQNFFFLDEGFGALDADSLQVVFETLKSLRQENRIVGVISHVEAMQQEIENALLVRLDFERGSLIETVS